MSLTDADKLQEVVVSYLPLSHIAAQMIDIWLPMKAGGLTCFAQPDALKVSVQIAHPSFAALEIDTFILQGCINLIKVTVKTVLML